MKPRSSSPSLKKIAGGPEDALSGLVERVTFHNPENGFAVLKVHVQGQRGLLTVLGTVPSVAPGEWITAQGIWERDREHGLQLKARTLKTQPPTSLEGIEKYLGSGLIKGIGPIYAKKLVKKFGENVFEIIEHHSKRLQEVEGIGSERRKSIKVAWAEQKVVRDIMLFLHAHGISTNRAARIYKTYGEGAIEIIRKNPYTLARDIHGIGFHSADLVASKLGFEPDSLLRARGAIDHLLSEATGEGHCALPKEELIFKAQELLAVPEEIILGALERHLHDMKVSLEKIRGEELIFLPHLRTAEEIIASKLQQLVHAPNPTPWIDPQKAIPWVEEKTKRLLSESQREALATALKHRVVVITGGPGVGKTTLLQSLLTILKAKKLRCLLAAPTGRAAQRLSMATGLEAKTVHRLLEFVPARGTFARNVDHPLEGDALIIDEVSMVDVPLMSSLLLAHPPEARLILVGDADQLPSVGPGLVLPDIIRSGLIKVVCLKEIFRQSQGSQIIQAAHAINEGILPDCYPHQEQSDFFFLEREDAPQTLSSLMTLMSDRIPKRYGFDPIDDLQVLAPMHRGSLGVHELNLRLQEILNPKHPDRLEHQAYGLLFREGDKIIQTSNNYEKEVFNGDIGRILSIDPAQKNVKVRFEDRRVTYDFSELDEITLAYAITIHKSQGSEFPVVLMPLAMQQYLLLQRNLLYTGVTRGRELVFLIGQRKALMTATHNASTRRRYGGLFHRLDTTNLRKHD